MISLISLLLDILIYKFINRYSLFLSLFTLLSIIFIKKDDKYYFKAILLGIIYDLVFTNYYIINMILFFVCSFIIKKYYEKFNFNTLNNTLLAIMIILVYQICLFVLFNVTKYNYISISDFVYIIKHYFILNIIYVIIITLLMNKRKK